MRLAPLVAAAGAFLMSASAAASPPGAHADPAAPVVLMIAVVLLAAMLGGHLAVRLGQPAVLGELLAGVLLGNVDLLGIGALEAIGADPSIDMFARVGVLVLLFEVGLESTVRQMLQVGGSALLVAVLGVAVPFGLGWGAGAVLLPDASPFTHAFLGATLTATSVGITARVLTDMRRSETPEARVILGAAVIDDVLGLIILTVVSGAVAAGVGGGLSWSDVGITVAKATLFLAGSLALGVMAAPRLFRIASRLQSRGVLLGVGLGLCFLLSWLASSIGLAGIVGAFAAGLVLESVHYRDFVNRGEHPLEDLVRPVSSLLVPIFFVVMGIRTDLLAFASGPVLALAAGLTICAVLGKLACGLGVLDKNVDRLTVALGMIPRGEVGLIFATIGLELRLNDEPLIGTATYSAIVVMVIVTTLVTPPLLQWRAARV